MALSIALKRVKQDKNIIGSKGVKINYLCTNDLYSLVHIVLDACISITRTSGRGLDP
jgi:hypothetical protein